MIAIVIRFLTGGLFLALWKPIAAILGALGLYAKGRTDARQRATAKARKAYIETRKRMDNADADLPDDIGVIRGLMQSRNPDKR